MVRLKTSSIKKNIAVKDLCRKSFNFLIPKCVFRNIISQIVDEYENKPRFKLEAYLAIQEATESHMASWFQDADLCRIHRKRKTLTLEDLKVASRLRGDHLKR